MRHEAVKQVGGQAPQIAEVAVAMLTVLLGAQKLDENLCLSAGELVDGVAEGWQVDEAGAVDVLTIVDVHCPDTPQRALK
ncbi:MAG: hypothetical protein M0Z82_04010 [Actinomycetota bacterium]|nr:hypothetical protein [Actinomycetota bacterium]